MTYTSTSSIHSVKTCHDHWCLCPNFYKYDDCKEQFYKDLDSVLRSTPPTDKLNLLGDSNAQMGSDQSNWDGAIRPHGVGKTNSNGPV